MPKREREEENTGSLPAKRQRGPNYPIINAAQRMARTRIQALYKANLPLIASTITLPKSVKFKNQTEEYQKIYESTYLARMLVELRENHLTIINKIQKFTQIEIELQKDLTIYKELQEKIQTTINTNAELIALLKEALQYNKELQITLQNIISKLNVEPEVHSAESFPIAKAKDNARKHTNKIIKKVGETAENISKIEISINDFAGYTGLTAYIFYKNNALPLEISLGHETYRRGDESYKQVYVERLLQRLQKFVSGDKVSIVIKNEGQQTTLPLRNESPVILEKQPLALESASTDTINDVLFITSAENSTANEQGNASQSIQASCNTLENANHRAREHTRFVLNKITNPTNISAIDFQIQQSSLNVVIRYGDGSSPLTIEVPSKTFFKSDIDSQNIYLEKLKQSLSNKLIRKTTASAQYYQTAGLSNNLFTHKLFEQTQSTNQHTRVENAQLVMELDDRFRFETTVMPLDDTFVFEEKAITSLAPEQHNITVETQAEELAERIFQSGQLQNKAKIKQMEIKCLATQKKIAILFQYRGNINPYLLNVDIADDFWQESKSERALYLKTLKNALEQKIMNFQSTPDQTKVRNAAVNSANYWTAKIYSQITDKTNVADIKCSYDTTAGLINTTIVYQNKSMVVQLPHSNLGSRNATYQKIFIERVLANLNHHLKPTKKHAATTPELQKILSNNLIKQSSSGSSYYFEEDQRLNINLFTQNPFVQSEPIIEQPIPISKDVIPSIQQENLQFQSQFFAPFPQQPSKDQTHPLQNPSQLGIDDANNFIKQIEATGKKPNLADKFRAPYRVFKNNEAAKKLYLLGFDTTFDQYVQNQNAAPKPHHNN